MPAIGIIRAAEIKELIDDYQALTLTLYGEARGLPENGKIAVGCVIQNRLRNRFRKARTIKDVCLARLQFSCWFEVGGPKNYQDLLRTAEIMIHEKSESWPKALSDCAAAAKRLLSGVGDITDGATHYYLDGTEEPSWAKPPAQFTAQIGGHLFFRNVK